MAGAATVDKALDVLFHLHAEGRALGLTEIGRALDLPKSSCHRLLASLVEREVVDRDERGRYRPGLALLALGIGAQRSDPVIAAARPALEDEAARLGETVFLVALRRGRLRVLDEVEGSGFLRAAPGVGDSVPFETTAAGKLYAVFGEGARLPDEARSVQFAADERASVERDGFAINRDAWIEGLSVLAVPVFRHRDRAPESLVGAIALAAASPHFDRLGDAEVARHLLAAADRVGHRLQGGAATEAFSRPPHGESE